jgi:uncharacterized protein
MTLARERATLRASSEEQYQEARKERVVDLVLLATIGAVSGLIAGLVGLAGGIVIVPALTWIYGPEALQSAIIVSWFSVMFNSVGAAGKQWRIRTADERAVLLAAARWYLLGAAVATPLIAAGATSLTGMVSKDAVGFLQLCLAAVMLIPVDEGGLPKNVNPVRDASFGSLIASISTVIGVGGGTYTIAYFVYGTGAKFRDAIATANFAGLTVGVLSVVGYGLASLAFGAAATSSHARISLAGMVLMVVAGLLCAPAGVAISTRLPVKRLRQILVAVLIISAVRLILL